MEVINELYRDLAMEYFLILKVNLDTKEYRCVFLDNSRDMRALKILKEIDNICNVDEFLIKYFENRIERDNKEDFFKQYANLDYIYDIMDEQQDSFYYHFKVKNLFSRKYEWVTMEVVRCEDYTDDNPMIFMRWKRRDRRSDKDCYIKTTSSMFNKVIKLEIKTELCRDITLSKDSNINNCDDFYNPGYVFNYNNIHKDDLDVLDRCVQLEYIKKRLIKNKKPISLYYRQKIRGSYKWFHLYIVLCDYSTKEKPYAFMYIRNIDKEYEADLRNRRQMEIQCNIDELTGFGNRHKYNNTCKRLNECKDKPEVGVIYADLNGLKKINDNYGHSHGDSYIIEFTQILLQHFRKDDCYRLGGDEFCVVIECISSEILDNKINSLRKSMDKLDNKHIASIGHVWSNCYKTVEDMVDVAEKNMYKEKKEYYKIKNKID